MHCWNSRISQEMPGFACVLIKLKYLKINYHKTLTSIKRKKSSTKCISFEIFFMFATLESKPLYSNPQRMKLLLTAFVCLTMACAHAQKGSAPEVSADNGTEINADGSNRFAKPIGLDLMGGNTKGITIYPNQTDDYLIVSVAGRISDKKSIAITSLTGKQIFRTANRTENTFMIDASGIGKGIYVIEVVSGSQVYRKKWAKRS